MTDEECERIKKVLETGLYESKELMDAVEAAMDSGNGLLEVWDRRVARDAEELNRDDRTEEERRDDEVHWPSEGWEDRFKRMAPFAKNLRPRISHTDYCDGNLRNCPSWIVRGKVSGRGLRESTFVKGY